MLQIDYKETITKKSIQKKQLINIKIRSKSKKEEVNGKNVIIILFLNKKLKNKESIRLLIDSF